MPNPKAKQKPVPQPSREFTQVMGWFVYILVAIAGFLSGTMAAGVLTRKLWQIIGSGAVLIAVGIWIWHDGRYMDRKYMFYAGLLFLFCFIATFLAEDWRRVP